MSEVDGTVEGTNEKYTLSGRILEALSPLNLFFGYHAPRKKTFIVVRTDDGELENFPQDEYNYPTGSLVTVKYSPKKTCCLKEERLV